MESRFQRGITASDRKTTNEFTCRTLHSFAPPDIPESLFTPIAHPM